MMAVLQLNLAFAAISTACQSWPADEDFEQYLQRLHRCLGQAGAGVGASAA